MNIKERLHQQKERAQNAINNEILFTQVGVEEIHIVMEYPLYTVRVTVGEKSFEVKNRSYLAALDEIAADMELDECV